MSFTSQELSGVQVTVQKALQVAGLPSTQADVDAIANVTNSLTYLIFEKDPVSTGGPGGSTKIITTKMYVPWSEVQTQMNAVGISSSSDISHTTMDFTVPTTPTVTFWLKEKNV